MLDDKKMTFSNIYCDKCNKKVPGMYTPDDWVIFEVRQSPARTIEEGHLCKQCWTEVKGIKKLVKNGLRRSSPTIKN